MSHSDDELRFMYENGQGHLTFFCIVFCLTRGTLQKKWFMYQNRLGPSNGIYYPNFVPCFVYHQLNTKPPHFNNFFKVKRSIQKSRKMSKAHPPELKKYMDKKIHLKINGGRAVEGVLRGFDPFMNLVLDDALEFTKSGDRNYIGMVVLRGNSVVMLEAKDRL